MTFLLLLALGILSDVCYEAYLAVTDLGSCSSHHVEKPEQESRGIITAQNRWNGINFCK